MHNDGSVIQRRARPLTRCSNYYIEPVFSRYASPMAYVTRLGFWSRVTQRITTIPQKGQAVWNFIKELGFNVHAYLPPRLRPARHLPRINAYLSQFDKWDPLRL